MMGKGLVHIYCGDGKGKTTASLGLAVRAAGRGMKVLYVQFFKDGNSSEFKALEKVENITFQPPERKFGFFWTLSDQEKAEAKAREAEEAKKNKTKQKALDEAEAAKIPPEVREASRSGMRQYARGRAYDPKRFGEVTSYDEGAIEAMFRAQAEAEQGKKKKKKDKNED